MLIRCRDGAVIVELRQYQRIVGSRSQYRRLLEQSISFRRSPLMADLRGELHHRQREARIVGSENALLDRQCLAEGLLGMGRVIDGVICIASAAEVVKALQVAATERSSAGSSSD